MLAKKKPIYLAIIIPLLVKLALTIYSYPPLDINEIKIAEFLTLSAINYRLLGLTLSFMSALLFAKFLNSSIRLKGKKNSLVFIIAFLVFFLSPWENATSTFHLVPFSLVLLLLIIINFRKKLAPFILILCTIFLTLFLAKSQKQYLFISNFSPQKLSEAINERQKIDFLAVNKKFVLPAMFRKFTYNKIFFSANLVLDHFTSFFDFEYFASPLDSYDIIKLSGFPPKGNLPLFFVWEIPLVFYGAYLLARKRLSLNPKTFLLSFSIALVNFFVIFSLYCLLTRKLAFASLLFISSLYVKASLLIFAPIFFIFALRQKYKFKEYLWAVIIPVFVIGFLTLPFSKGEPFSYLFYIYKDKVFTQQLQVITANAFNLWSFVAGINERPHAQLLGPLTYQTWGLILFAISYLPSLYIVYKKQTLKSLAWSLSIAAFGSFILLTNMHERYLYPLFPVFTILIFLEPGLTWIYWTISGINLLNLYNFWFTPKIGILISLMTFKERVMTRVLGLVDFSIFVYFYYRFCRLLKTYGARD